MSVKAISIAAMAVICIVGVARAVPSASPLSDKPQRSVAPSQAAISTYRAYVKEQADTLVGMTRVLAKAVEHGDLDAAQSTYAPTHRYFKRIEPLARTLHGLERSMDARADAYEGKHDGPAFTGFHQLEHGLFARRSTADLTNDAERLQKDARGLRQQAALLEIVPGALLDEAAKLVRDIADHRLDGSEERYSKTDLWDIEANLDGVRQIVALVQPQLRDQTKSFERLTIRFAEIDSLVEKHKAGCGFKNYDEVSKDDKTALRGAVTALAEELSVLRGALAMD